MSLLHHLLLTLPLQFPGPYPIQASLSLLNFMLRLYPLVTILLISAQFQLQELHLLPQSKATNLVFYLL